MQAERIRLIQNVMFSYRLDAVEGGTRITLHHTGFSIPEICMNTAIGWETSFGRLAQVLGSEPK
jgi:hypothetical protein